MNRSRYARFNRMGPLVSWESALYFCLCLYAFPASAANPFAENVRTTDPLTPVEQQRTFHLPPGFEIQLVASEPDINKPMNMAFDSLGRLWVTTSREYPFPAPLNQPARDRVMVFEDFGPDGKARKVTQFADGLNIPIGIYPFQSPNGQGRETWKAVVWSIPNIWLMEDTDGDGRADTKEILFGPFDHTRDTHGNQASFRRGFDGWLYATHGFNNHSRVRGRDGHEVDMQSGNTYRMRLDGSRIEQHTWGQVNPFGLAWDALGNMYSSDCHSAPVYQLLTGGYYPSFGKPHDGLGFAPVLMEHSHGSTAIDGMLYYSDDLWPEEFHENTFIGNVMTSRVNRDHLVFHGSSPQAIEQDDFVKTEDPWFRPVDNRLGPDGAFYIADFYNRIIGHYEVPLSHPGRDRERGRIWRVVYKEKPLRASALASSLEGLVAELASANLPRRMLAMSAITDRFPSQSAPLLLQAFRAPANDFQRIHAMWALDQLDALPDELLREAAGDEWVTVRVHAMRVIAERGLIPARLGPQQSRRHGLSAEILETVRRGLRDTNALVRRCAAEALGNAPAWANVEPLLALVQQTPPEDTHLLYMARKSLRNQLTDDGVFSQVLEKSWAQKDLQSLLDVTVAVQTELAGSFLIRHRIELAKDADLFPRALQHAARYAPTSSLDQLAQSMDSESPLSLGFQLDLFKAIEQGLAQRGTPLSPMLQSWGRHLAARALVETDRSAWFNTPMETATDKRNPWTFQTRPQADGGTANLLSSHPLGEQLTGTLRSPLFSIPPQLTFYLSGHDGYPNQPAQKRNAVRLYSKDGKLLAEAPPPRNDTAQRIVWDLAAHAQGTGYLEAVDGDSSAAYAWIAFGRFDPPVLQLPQSDPATLSQQRVAALELIQRLGPPAGEYLGRKAGDWNRTLRELAVAPGENAVRIAALRAYAARGSVEEASRGLAPILENGQEPLPVREAAGVTLASLAPQTVGHAMKTSPRQLNVAWAQALAASPAGSEALLEAVTNGDASPRLLQERAVRDRLLAGKSKDLEDRVAALTKNLAPANEAMEKLMNDRRREFRPEVSDLAAGQRLFEQSCALCHRVDGQGGLVGPQLDGIGNRGMERLVEDIADPNRNVDRAFRTTIFTLKDGDIVSGLLRREEGAQIILADSTAKEIALKKEDIEGRFESDSSLMPDNFLEVIPPSDFNNLLAFLLSKNAATEGK